jgi:ligand-binding SRPBCC domain-containing protein
MHHLQFKQSVRISQDECWKFFSSPSNLKLLTPPYLGFVEVNGKEKAMYAGQIILHRIRPLFNIPVDWVTEITHVDEPHYFIDEQRFGPYRFWHHEHRFIATSNGTDIIDSIYYKLPFCAIGRIINRWKVAQDINRIFEYRRHVIEERYMKGS